MMLRAALVLASCLVVVSCGTPWKSSPDVKRARLVEWGAPWSPKIQILLKEGGVLELGRGLSSADVLTENTTVKAAEGQITALLEKLSTFRSARGVSAKKTDGRRLLVHLESASRDWDVTIRGDLSSEEVAIVHELNLLVPPVYRLEEGR
jgi:hypothetical protein